MKSILVLLLVLALAGGGGFWYWSSSQNPTTDFRTAPVQRGDLSVTINATGTVEPVEVVDVGAQVAGRIVEFGKDPNDLTKPIDYGTEVNEGTVLARIDDSLYAADVAQAEAALAQANANLVKAQADLGQMKAKLNQAQKDWNRAQELGPSRALAASEYDSYEAAYETAKATVGVGEATIEQSRKAVAAAQATLDRTQTNWSYCTIKSPVKGKIIDRRVNIGQTVVASLNAPSLFLIGKDLTKLQVWVAVNEADIGNIRPGQSASFTVDAFPGRVFQGVVGKVRLNASMTQNVVTYTVEVNTDNPDGKLLPYLTANVNFEIDTRKNVLMVPNAAVRWKPEPQQVGPEFRAAYASEQERRSGPDSQQPGPGGQRRGPGGAGRSGPPRSAGPRAAQDDKGPGKAADGGAAGTARGQVWVRDGEDGEYVKPVNVIVGPSDTTMTEIRSDALKEHDEVVVGEAELGPGDQTTNPFMPQFRRRRR